MNRWTFWFVIATLIMPRFAISQEGASEAETAPPGFNLLDQLGPLGGPPGLSGEQLTLSAKFSVDQDSRRGRLTVTGRLAPAWHVYSITQKPGGPLRSELEVDADQLQVTGPFVAVTPPKIKFYDFYPGLPVEEHGDEVVWEAPLELVVDAIPEEVAAKVIFTGQVCQDDGVCIPINDREVPVSFAGFVERPTPSGEYRPDKSHVAIRGQLIRQSGSDFELVLSAHPDPNWHVYRLENQDPVELTKPTLIVLNLPEGWEQTAAQASSEALEVPTGLEEQPLQYYYESDVQWTVDITAPADIEQNDFTITGAIAYQTCTKSQCDLPTAAEFSVPVRLGRAESGDAIPLEFREGTYAQVATLAAARAPAEDDPTSPPTGGGLQLDALEVDDQTSQTSLWVVLPTALLAGFILNFMPCVLPVIGLKVMAFVQQSGDSRGRVFMLNLWYCVGLMSVFLVLATLAVFANLGWGQQFSSGLFNVILSSVVFAFALSFLGIWEIPIPGFVGSGAVGDLATKEGPSGAFFKGVLTTILATPCSGPLLTPALTWAVGQPPAIAYAGFGAVGLGMASPYLLIGAFPRLVSFLPKPGAWMETFKHLMGFVLLGTVVFLMTFMPFQLVVPTLAFMIGLWAALWWVGRTPITADTQVKLRAWVGGAAFATLIGLVAFSWLDEVMESRFRSEVDRLLASRFSGEEPQTFEGSEIGSSAESESELPWQAFSLMRLEKLTKEGRTVFVDFTADW